MRISVGDAVLKPMLLWAGSTECMAQRLSPRSGQVDVVHQAYQTSNLAKSGPKIAYRAIL